MTDPAARFSPVAGQYDAVRPMPPAALADVIRQWAGIDDPEVVDLGAGTGLSTVIWAGRERCAARSAMSGVRPWTATRSEIGENTAAPTLAAPAPISIVRRRVTAG